MEKHRRRYGSAATPSPVINISNNDRYKNYLLEGHLRNRYEAKLMKKTIYELAAARRSGLETESRVVPALTMSVNAGCPHTEF